MNPPPIGEVLPNGRSATYVWGLGAAVATSYYRTVMVQITTWDLPRRGLPQVSGPTAYIKLITLIIMCVHSGTQGPGSHDAIRSHRRQRVASKPRNWGSPVLPA